MPPAPHNLPHQLSEKSFRLYEDFIAHAVKQWPAESVFQPVEIAITTFTARFRDAVASFRRFGWATQKIDTEKFKSIDGQFVIRHDYEKNVVYFCQRHAAGRSANGAPPPAVLGNAPTAKPVASGILTDLTESELHAFCLLLNNKRIEGPVLVQGQLGDQIVQILSMSYDVGITFDPLTSTTLIL